MLFVLLTNSANLFAQACNTPYVAGTVYVGGATVSHNGKNFTAKYWTQNEAPNPANQWGAWSDNGACASCTLLPGIIGTSQSITSNSIPNPLTNVTSASVNNGGTIVYQWQKSTNNSTWTDIAGATSSVYSPGTITSKTFFRRKVSVSGCTEAYSPSVVISIAVNNNLDTDNDGILDTVDLDDDNDGILDCVENGFEQVNLSNVFNVAGSANYKSTNEIQLTPDLVNQAGSAMSFGKIDFNKDFNFNVEVFLGLNDGGADGMAIVFHNDPNGINAVGISGSGLGAEGIKNGISIEFDTYNNGELVEDHTHIKLTQTWGDLTTMKALPNIEDGQWHLVNFNWNASSQTLNYSFDGNLMASFTNDLVTNVFNNESNVYFGFTASTGGAINEQKIRIPDSFCSYPIFKDTDNDGIVNSLDTDSDGDGCDDAIEGGASFTPTNLTSNRLSGGVDANGIPVIATSSGQTIGTSDNANSKDVVCSLCTSDNDADGVCDNVDLDDDNDGILDKTECTDNSGSWDFETPALSSGSSNQGTSFQGWDIVGGGWLHLIKPPYGSGTPNTAASGNQYVEVGGNGDISRTYTVASAGNLTVEIDFANWCCSITEQTQINIFKADGTTLVAQSPIISTPPADINNAWIYKGRVSANLTPGDYIIKFFLGNYQAFDNVKMSFASNVECDTDNDGIINRLDTDSDGDGCADAIEGGANFTTANLTGNSLSGSVNSQGVPIIAGVNGQTIGSSQNVSVKDVECVECTKPTVPVVNGVSSEMIYSFVYDSQQPLNATTPVLTAGKEYKFKISGTYSVWTTDATKHSLDAAYRFADQMSGAAITPIENSYIKLNGGAHPRPVPNQYNASHEYWYNYTGTGQALNFAFTDSYGDNNGSLTYTFYAPIDTIKACASTTTTSLSQYVTGTNLLWYTAQTGGVGSSTVPVVNNSNAQLYTYWVSQTVNGCESERAPLYYKILSKPTVVANGGSICIGSSKTLTASGATTYTWSPSTNLSATTGASVTANPSITTVYTVSTINANGCEGTDTAVVTVNALPTVSATGPVYVGSTINASPTTGGTWTSSNTALATIINAGVITGVSAGSVTFTFTNTATSCSSTTSTIDILLGQACYTTWDLNTQYVKDSKVSYNGRNYTAQWCCSKGNIPGNPPPSDVWLDKGSCGACTTPIISTSDTKVCVGSTLTASPTSGGTWTSSNTNIATISNAGLITGVASGTVTFTFTNATGCSNTTNSISVNSLPSVSANGASICIGDSKTITASGTANYTWSPNTNLSAITGSTVTANPSITTVYTVEGTDANGCKATDTAKVTINALPNVTGSASPSSICTGSATTLKGSGANSYTWDNSVTDNVAFNPTTTKTYTVTGTDANGCIGTNTAVVTVTTCTIICTSDTDGDGVCDKDDLDDDNDGILDEVECPSNLISTNFSSTNGTTVTFNAPAADEGFQLDIYNLDNSFNLNINGTKLVSNELQFTPTGVFNAYLPGQSLVVFESDLSPYSENGIQHIHEIIGNSTNPVIRLIFNKNGTISLWGKRSLTSPFEKMIIKNSDPQFNTVIWNNTSINQIILSQLVYGGTFIEGMGSGIQKCTTDTDGDGIINSLDTDADGDGCADAIEGSAAFKKLDLSGQVLAGAVDSKGVPVIAGASGQTVGSSQNASLQDADCANCTNPVIGTQPTAGSAICVGANKTFTVAATGTTLTYQWYENTTNSNVGGTALANAGVYGGVTTASLILTTPLVSLSGKYYYVIVKSAGACPVSSNAVLLTVNALPVVSVTGPVCIGATITASPTTGGTWTSADANKASITNAGLITGVTTGTTTFTFTNTATSCQATTASVTVNALPTVSLGKDTILCQGSNITLNAGVANTYKWNDNSTLQTLLVSTDGTYDIIITDNNNCTASDQISITYKNCNKDLIVEDSIAICKGKSETINAKNVKTPFWESTEPFVKVNDSTITATPTKTAKYYVTSYTKKINSLVNGDFETPNIGGGFSVLDATTVTGWKTTATDNAIEVWYNNFMGVPAYSGNQFIELNANMVAALYQDIPTIPGTKLNWEFAHRGRNGVESMDFSIGAPGGPYVKLGTYDDGTDKWGSYAGIYEVPAGQTTTRFYFTSNGGGSVGNFLDAISFYTLDEQKDSVVVTVNELPTVVVANGASICTGSSKTLSASGASTYSWSPNTNLSATTGATVTANPTNTIVYTVIGTDNKGCVASDTAKITVNALPIVTGAATPSSICIGSATTLKGSGASSYTWDNGVLDNVAFNPTTSKTYAVTGTDANGCKNTSTVSVTVNALPIVTGAATPNTICIGSATTLKGSGASSYTWDNSVTENVAFNPTTTKTYTVTGTDANGCKNTGTVSVTVNALPIVTAAATPSSICLGGSTTLKGSGASSYTWDNSVTENVAFNPTTTKTYTVTGTDANGCKNTSTVSVTINTLPTVTGAATKSSICVGGSTTLNGSGASSYTWDNSVTENVAFNPTTTKTYTVTGTDANGCKNTSTVSVTVNALPIVTGAATKSSICLGSSTYLKGSGASSYTWSPNANLTSNIGNAVTASPTDTVIYIVTGTDNNGCVGTDTAVISVIPTPSMQLPNNQELCNNEFTKKIDFVANFANVNFEWKSSSNLYNGLNEGKGSIEAFKVENITKTELINTIEIQPSFMGCKGLPQKFDIKIHPTPHLVISSFSSDYCAGDTFKLQLKNDLPNQLAYFAWKSSANNAEAKGFTNQSFTINDLVSDLLSTTKVSKVTYVFYTQTSHCKGDSLSKEITLYPMPKIISQTLDTIVCANKPFGLNVNALGDEMVYQWQAKNGLTFSNLQEDTHFKGVKSNDLQLDLAQSKPFYNKFRLAIQSKYCTKPQYSQEIKIDTIVAPIISKPLTNLTLCAGADTLQSLNVQGNNLKFEWKSPDVSSNNIATLQNVVRLKSIDTIHNNKLVEVRITDFCGISINNNFKISVLYPVLQKVINDSTCSGVPINIPLKTNYTNSYALWNVKSSPLLKGYKSQVFQNNLNSIRDTITNLSADNDGIIEYAITPYVANCKGKETLVKYKIFPKTDLKITGPFTDICPGSKVNVVASSFKRGTYEWFQDESQLMAITSTAQLLANEDTSLVKVVYTDKCNQQFEALTYIYPLPKVKISLSEEMDLCQKVDMIFQPQFSNYGFDKLVWKFGETADSLIANKNETKKHFFYDQEGTYNFSIDAYRNTCKVGTYNKLMKVNNCTVELSNFITPNGDGSNDELSIENIEKFPKSTLVFFDRWGQKVWSSNANYLQNQFKGTNAKGENLENGVYYYILDLNTSNEKLNIKKGYVTVMR